MPSKRLVHQLTRKTLFIRKKLEKSLPRRISSWNTTQTFQVQPWRPSESKGCRAQRVVTVLERKNSRWYSLIQKRRRSLCYLISSSIRPKLNFLLVRTFSAVQAYIRRLSLPRPHSSAKVKSKRAPSHKVTRMRRMSQMSPCATVTATY